MPSLLSLSGCFGSFVALERPDAGEANGDAGPHVGADAGRDGGPELPPLPTHALCRVVGLDQPRDLAYAPDGSRVAVAANDEAVRIFDPEDGRELRQLLGHPVSGATRVRFRADGGIVTLASDGVRLFDAAGELERMIARTDVRDVDVDADGGLVLLLVTPEIVRVRDDGTEISRFAVWPELVAGTLASSPDRTRYAVAGRVGMRIFDAEGSVVAGVVTANVDRPGIAWSADGRALAMTQLVRDTVLETVRIYDTETAGVSLAVHGPAQAHAVALSSDFRRLIAGRAGGVDVFALEPGPSGIPRSASLERSFDAPDEVVGVAFGSSPHAFAYTARAFFGLTDARGPIYRGDLALDAFHGFGLLRGDRLLTRDARWNLRDGRADFAGVSVVDAVDASPDGAHYAVGNNLGVTIVGPDGHPVADYETASGAHDVAFAPDGEFYGVTYAYVEGRGTRFQRREVGRTPALADDSVGSDGFVLSGFQVGVGAGHLSFELGPLGVEVRRADGFLLLDQSEPATTPGASSFSPDGETIALVASGSTRIVALEGGAVRTLPAGPQAARSVSFSSDGAYLLEGGSELAWVREVASGDIVEVLGPRPPSPGGLPGLSMTPDGARIAVGGEATARIYCAPGDELF